MKSHVFNQAHLQTSLYAFLIGAAFLLMSFVPFSAEAATSKPSCALTVSVGADSEKITKEGDVIVPKGGLFGIAWTSRNAKSAELDGNSIGLSGSRTFSPRKTTTYEFIFKNGSKKTACEVTAHIANGSIDGISSGSKPTLSGKATGTKKVSIALYEKGKSKAVFEKKNIPVKRGVWEAKTTKTLPKGEYQVVLTGDKDYDLNTLASATLTIGNVNTLSGGVGGSSKGVLSVTTIPLLGGGTIRANEAKPVSYLQLRNTGSEAVHVTGFTVKQNGTASTNAIASLSTVDDKGGSRDASAMNPFRNGVAVAPTDATIEPGSLKLFTIKAMLGANVTVGTNLMLDVTGVENNGTEKGAFPIRGTTWTIGY